MSDPPPALLREAEFLALPETMQRVELLDGEVIVSPSLSVWHQELLSRVVERLRAWSEDHAPAAYVGLSPVDVRFGAGRILQPDAFVVLDGLPLDLEGPIDRILDLCVEVLSTNPDYDRLTKRLVYADSGVRELWLVEPSGAIERWSGQGLEESEIVADHMTTKLLPGLELDVGSLFCSD